VDAWSGISCSTGSSASIFTLIIRWQSIPPAACRRIDILEYRESYGGEVRSPSWLGQFVGKSSASPLAIGQDIRNLSGATLSSQHLTQGVKRILAAYAARGR
jgi:hypothetical protein